MSGIAIHIVRETALRTWVKTLRRPMPLSFSFIQPLFWMLIFGFLFHRFTLGPAYAGLSYLDFLLPGVCAMTVLFGASQAGVNIVRDLQTGFIKRMAGSTSYPGWIMAGMITADVTRFMAQAVVVCLLGIALGARLHVHVGSLLMGIVGLALFAVAYASLSCWIALKARAQESMAVFVHVVNMPLLFTSTALAPSKQMPVWLEGATRWNPLTLVADALRNALVLGKMSDPLMLLPLAALATLFFFLARWEMTRAAYD